LESFFLLNYPNLQKSFLGAFTFSSIYPNLQNQKLGAFIEGRSTQLDE